jgi:ketosteroid isomerase-like protein
MLALAAVMLAAAMVQAAPLDDRATVAALDVRYQAAVKANDAETMAAILADDMVLVVGRGDVVTRADLLDGARAASVVYEQQDEEPGSQTVRMYGRDTAVVTAKLWLKYTTGGKAFDRRLWFSDTYVRTAKGWKYAFGQASLALPGPT